MKFSRRHYSLKPGRNRENPDAVRHQELETKIKLALRRLKASPLNGSDYVTYAIKERVRQVGKPDTDIPFYVGQTSDLARRAQQHIQLGGQPCTDTDSVYWRLYQVLAAFKMPLFEVLERTPTLATSLLSESAWVHQLRSEGYRIWNQWTEHQPGKFTGMVPARRLWNCTLREALMDRLQLCVACTQCHLHLELPLDTLGGMIPLQTTMGEIRSGFTCPACGACPCLRVSTYGPAG